MEQVIFDKRRNGAMAQRLWGLILAEIKNPLPGELITRKR